MREEIAQTAGKQKGGAPEGRDLPGPDPRVLQDALVEQVPVRWKTMKRSQCLRKSPIPRTNGNS